MNEHQVKTSVNMGELHLPLTEGAGWGVQIGGEHGGATKKTASWHPEFAGQAARGEYYRENDRKNSIGRPERHVKWQFPMQ